MIKEIKFRYQEGKQFGPRESDFIEIDIPGKVMNQDITFWFRIYPKDVRKITEMSDINWSPEEGMEIFMGKLEDLFNKFDGAAYWLVTATLNKQFPDAEFIVSDDDLPF